MVADKPLCSQCESVKLLQAEVRGILWWLSCIPQGCGGSEVGGHVGSLGQAGGKDLWSLVGVEGAGSWPQGLGVP